MSRGTKQSGLEIAAFARKHGISQRTARLWRARGDDRWQAWRDAGGFDTGARETDKELREWERAAAARDDAYMAMTRLSEAMRTASPDALPALARAYSDARKTWEAACDHANRTAADAGTLIPLPVIREMQERIIGAGLAPALRAFAQNIAQRLSPATRAEFFNAEREERPRLFAAIRQLDEEIENLLRHA